MKWVEDKWLIMLIIVSVIMLIISIINVMALFISYTSQHASAIQIERVCQDKPPYIIHSNKGMQRTIDGKELQG